ncbi:MAG TPA: 30S ribosomal protein S4 [Dehalococcoidia bacterium]|nr:30S ribosomal protein S4 [Dehalococcoidia bacterium]
MARYLGPRCALCRYIGDKLMLKGDKCLSARCPFERRGNVPPGGRSKTRRRISDRGMQLREKQKVRFTYGVLEAQFRRFFAEAERLPGMSSDNILVLLERRLDNVVYRLGFGTSRQQARQIVRHGHIRVNERRVDIPSYLVKAGDVISWRPQSSKTALYKVIAEQVQARNVPSWLRLDEAQMKATVVSLPTPEDVDSRLSGKAVVEYYSR